MKSTGLALHYKYNILYINKLHNKYQFPSVRATASYLPHNCIIPVIATTFRLPPCHCLPASVTIRCPALPGRTTFRLTPRTGIIPPPRTTPHLPLRTKPKQNKTKQNKTRQHRCTRDGLHGTAAVFNYGLQNSLQRYPGRRPSAIAINR